MNRLEVHKYVKPAFDTFLAFSQEHQYTTFNLTEEWVTETKKKYYVLNTTTFSFSDVHDPKPAEFFSLAESMLSDGTADWFRFAKFEGQDEHMFSVYVFARDLHGNCDYAAMLIERGWIADFENEQVTYSPEKYEEFIKNANKQDGYSQDDLNLLEEHDAVVREHRTYLLRKLTDRGNIILAISTAIICFTIVAFNLLGKLVLSISDENAEKLYSLIILLPVVYAMQKVCIPVYANAMLPGEMHKYIMTQKIANIDEEE